MIPTTKNGKWMCMKTKTGVELLFSGKSDFAGKSGGKGYREVGAS